MLKLKTRRIAQVVTLSLGSAFLFCGGAAAQTVHNTNVTIHSSLCVGIDCLTSESYGFDTIRMKENNTRINFEDTSTGTFPSTDWEIRANDSASGGANYLGIVDRGTGSVIGRFGGGAPNNAFVIESDGDAGFGTLSPVVDLHAVDGNTPALRLEQNGSSGFTPQTWDIAGNEASFFVRDATGGSTLPFRIFPGAPNGNLIVRGGNVGVGTVNPTLSVGGAGLDIVSATNPEVHLHHTASGIGPNDGANIALTGTDFILTNREAGDTLFFVNGAVRMRIASNGDVRIAGLTNCPGIQTDGSGVLSCTPSTRSLKNIAGALDPHVALANVMALKPQVGAYKTTPDVPEHWLIAEDVAEVEPAFVGLRDGEPFAIKTYGVVTDLIAVIQMQQQRIEALEEATAGR
jgi:hypothetical protein